LMVHVTFSQKNSAVLHGDFQCKSCQLLPEGRMVVQHSNEIVQIQLSGNKH